MPAIYVFGRILFVVLFVASGISKLTDIAGTTQAVSQHVTIPAQFASYVAQIESVTKMPIAQLIAIATGALEVTGGVLIALNFGARIFAVLLALFSVATIFYFHDFWNMTGAERVDNMIHALKNVSIIGALLMIASSPRGVGLPRSSSSYDEV